MSKTIGERSRQMASLAAASLLAAALISAPTGANAYATTGCKWSTGNLKVNMSATNGTMRTALYSALNNYTVGTDTNLTGVTASGPTFRAANNNYGATGWAGQNTWTCAFGATSSSLARVNDYYNANVASNEGRIRVIWLHEIGHGLGLDHVSPIARVMHTPTSDAYNAGAAPTPVLSAENTYLLYLTPSGLAAPLDSQFYVTGANAGVFASTRTGARGTEIPSEFLQIDPEPGERLPSTIKTDDARRAAERR